MSKDTLKVILQNVLKFGGAYLVAKGITDDSQVEIAIAGIISISGIIWNWVHTKDNKTATK